MDEHNEAIDAADRTQENTALMEMLIDPERKRQKLEAQLVRTMELEKRAATRVKRAVTLHQKYVKARRRIEARIGAAEVQRIIARLHGGK